MTDSSPSAFDPVHLRGFAGAWEIDAAHGLLPGDPISGEATFEWLADGPFLVQRTHFDHPQIPDALAVVGLVDGRPRMTYFDARGVHRSYDVETSDGVLRYALTLPGFSQRYVAELGGDDDVIAAAGELSRDGATWQEDLKLTYRRTA